MLGVHYEVSKLDSERIPTVSPPQATKYTAYNNNQEKHYGYVFS